MSEITLTSLATTMRAIGTACQPCRACYEAHAQGLLTTDALPTWRRRQQAIQRAMQAAFVRE